MTKSIKRKYRRSKKVSKYQNIRKNTIRKSKKKTRKTRKSKRKTRKTRKSKKIVLKGGTLTEDEIKEYIKHLYNRPDLQYLPTLNNADTDIMYKICVDIIKTILYDEILQINNTFLVNENIENINSWIQQIFFKIQMDQYQLQEKLNYLVNLNLINLRKECNKYLTIDNKVDEKVTKFIGMYESSELKQLMRAIQFQSYLPETKKKLNKTKFKKSIHSNRTFTSNSERFNKYIKVFNVTNPVIKNYEKINQKMQNSIITPLSFNNMYPQICELKTQIDYIKTIAKSTGDFNINMCKIIDKFLLNIEPDVCPNIREVLYAKIIYISYRILVKEKTSDFNYYMIPYFHPSVYNMEHTKITYNRNENVIIEKIRDTIKKIFCCKPGAVKAENCKEILKVFPINTFEVECKNIYDNFTDMLTLLIDKNIKPKNIVFMNN